MLYYALLKGIHITTALISAVLFMLRLWLDQRQRPWRQTALRWLPHLNDTVLLAAAITLLVLGGWNPLQQHWLLAKIIVLLGYIGAGREALKGERTLAWRRGFALLACALLAMIFALALTKPSF